MWKRRLLLGAASVVMVIVVAYGAVLDQADAVRGVVMVSARDVPASFSDYEVRRHFRTRLALAGLGYNDAEVRVLERTDTHVAVEVDRPVRLLYGIRIGTSTQRMWFRTASS